MRSTRRGVEGSVTAVAALLPVPWRAISLPPHLTVVLPGPCIMVVAGALPSYHRGAHCHHDDRRRPAASRVPVRVVIALSPSVRLLGVPGVGAYSHFIGASRRDIGRTQVPEKGADCWLVVPRCPQEWIRWGGRVVPDAIKVNENLECHALLRRSVGDIHRWGTVP